MKHYIIDSALFAAQYRESDPETYASINRILRSKIADEVADYTALLKRARLDRAQRVARAEVAGGWSMDFLAKEAGIVPHRTSSVKRGCLCARVIRVNRNAASVLRYRVEHALPGSIYGETAWGESARATR